MIDIKNYRSNGTAKEVLLSNPLRTLEEALRQLLVSELGFGGIITKSSEMLIEVQTDVMSCHDRTVFTGPEEEMKELFMVLLLWHEAEKKVSFDEWWKKVSEAADGVPLYVKMLAPQIKGELVFREMRKLA